MSGPIAAVPGDTSWVYRRPAPTMVGSFCPDVAAPPGYRKAGDGPRQKQPGAVRLTAEQAAILQSHPPFEQGSSMNHSDHVVIDLFAGTGWGVACQRLGVREYGVEMMKEAVATRAANGMETIYNDVWDAHLLGEMLEAIRDYNNGVMPDWTLIASPPCQTFSMAGKGAGRKALDDVLATIESGVWKDIAELREWAVRLGDDRIGLVLTPLYYAYRYRPAYIALEQVPPVLPVWKAMIPVLEEMGYSAKAEILNAEQYGVPQTRRRAILAARRTNLGEVALPTPTHSRYYSRSPEKLDAGVLPWVSMAEALGWGMTERPYPTVSTGAATAGGGTDPAALGGSGARKTVYAERAEGRWTPSGDADNDGGVLRLSAEEAARLQSYPASTMGAAA